MGYETVVGEDYLYMREVGSTSMYSWNTYMEQIFYLAQGRAPVLTIERATPFSPYIYSGSNSSWTFAAVTKNSSGSFLYKEGF